MFLQRVLLWSAIGMVLTGVMVACGAGSKINDCQKRGYERLTQEYGGTPPQDAVNRMTKQCVDRYQGK